MTPNGSDVITEINSGGQITVEMGRKIYDDPNNPYGVDLIVYGNSFFSASGHSGIVSDETDLNTATLSSGIYGHPTTVSVSQDGTNWYTYSNTPVLFPDNAYRWDDPNASWTDEQMNPTKPLNPFIYTNNFSWSNRRQRPRSIHWRGGRHRLRFEGVRFSVDSIRPRATRPGHLHRH